MKLVSLVFILFFVTSLVYGQVTSSSPNVETKRPVMPEVLQVQTRFNELTTEVSDHFKKGLIHLKDNRRSLAHKEFDKTIEVFLMSNVNIQSNQKLRECYSQLTETIYQMEFPTGNQLLFLKSVGKTCGWNIDTSLVESVAKVFQSATSDKNQGFTEQKFEGSKFVSSESGYAIKTDVASQGRMIQSNQVNACRESDSPIIQGLRLDTPMSLVKRDSKLDFSKAKKFSVFTANDSYLFVSPNKNVRSLILNFYKDNIVSMSAYYSSEIHWSSLEEFRQKIVDTLGVSGTWATAQTVNETNTTLQCKNFTITLTKNGEEYRLFSVSKIVYDRRKKDISDASKEKTRIQQRKKEVFKP
jgi:hypothetical protein